MSFQQFHEQCEKLVGDYANLLEKPAKGISADLALPCFALAKEQRKNPVEIAKELAKDMKPSGLIKRIEAAGPYVNFYADWDKIGKELLLRIMNAEFGVSRQKEKIMIEYSGPNTNKPLHVGHLRNDSIGMAVSNILEFTGNHVLRTNIINDRGVHICKSMLAYKKWGDKKTPQSENKKSDHFVGDFYVLFEKKLKENPELENEIHEMLQKWEAGDKSVRRLWKKMNGWTMDGLKETYKLFGSKFDLWPLESQFYNKAKPILEEGTKKGIFSKNEKGDLIAKLEPGLPNKVVLRADGTSIYITNDIALTRHRFEKYGINRCIWVVATEQNLHFNQMFSIFEMLGYEWAKNCYHLGYGLVNLPSGRMKTREGNVVDADEVIKEETELAKQEILSREPKIEKKELEKRSLEIALAAIKYYLLKTEPVKDIMFDPNKAIRFEGDTGPYIQYTYARAMSILRKSQKKAAVIHDFGGDEIGIIKKLSEFPGVVQKAATELRSNHLAVFLFELATQFNEFYHAKQVIGAEREETLLAVAGSVASVLKTGLQMLVIKALDRM